MQKAAPTRKRLPTKKSCNLIVQDYSKKSKYDNSGLSNNKKRYPHSAYSVKLSKPCRYCNYGIGLIIIRYKDDKGFCKCGRCDAALFSLNEDKPQKKRSEHIGAILDSYLPYGEVAQ